MTDSSTNQVFGPVAVDAGWGDVFKPKDAADVNAGWLTNPTGYAVLAGAISTFFADLANGALLLELADSISIVVRSAPTSRSTWARRRHPADEVHLGARGQHRLLSQDGDQLRPGQEGSDGDDREVPGRRARSGTRRTPSATRSATTSGSTTSTTRTTIPGRDQRQAARGVDLMSTSDDLPHFSIANRVRLGWVDRTWLRRFDFSAIPVGGPVVLQSTETLTGAGPTGGRAAGIEVPIMDDWSYLFEYRNEQPGQIGDQRLEGVVVGRTQIVVGTDLRVRGGDVARPPILRLAQRPDDDGPVLVNDGQNYRDDDTDATPSGCTTSP